MLISAFITHKKAETFRDCQDRFSINRDTKSIAVSDGLSQSIFQKIWAEQLVQAYTSDSEWVPNLESVKEIAPQWSEKVKKYIENEERQGRNPWRAKNSINAGMSAGATILGLRFHEKDWAYDVLGDSCLIRIKDSHIKEIISSNNNVVFDNYPDYYDSNPKKSGRGTLKSETRHWEAGEVLVLVSDPFSDFLSKKKDESDESILIDKILGINGHKEFEALVSEWRELGMHNDDSTLVIVKQDGSPDFNLLLDCVDDIDSFIKAETSEKSDLRSEEEPPIETKRIKRPLVLDSLKQEFDETVNKFFPSSKKKYRVTCEMKNKLRDELIDVTKKFLETDGTTGNNW